MKSIAIDDKLKAPYTRPNVFFRNEGMHIVFISDLKNATTQ